MKQVNVVAKNKENEIITLDKHTDLGNGLLIVDIVTEHVERWLKNGSNVNSLNISGRWGTGKTTIAYNVLNKFVNDEGIECLHLNLWEYEFSTNPYFHVLVDLLSKMRIDAKYLKKQFSKIGWKFKMGVSIYDADFWISLGRNETQTPDRESLNERIVKTINEVLATSKKKYIILVDELDRCNPQKIIELLSLVKRVIIKLENCFIISCTNNEIIRAIEQKMYPTGNKFCENYADKIFSNVLDLDILNVIENIPTELKNVPMRSGYIELTRNPLITDFINKTKELKGNYRFLKNVSVKIKNLLNDEKNVLTHYAKISAKEPVRALAWLQFMFFFLMFIKKIEGTTFIEIVRELNSYPTKNYDFHRSVLFKNLSFAKDSDKVVLEENKTPMGFSSDFIFVINDVSVHWVFFEKFFFNSDKTIKVKSLERQLNTDLRSGLQPKSIFLEVERVHKNQWLMDFFHERRSEFYLIKAWHHLSNPEIKKLLVLNN